MNNVLIFLHRIVFNLNKYRIPILPNLINKIFIRICFSCQIGLNTKIGKGVILGYGGLSVVIHDRAVIGDYVIIGAGVSIGGTTKKYDVPVIGNNCIIYNGAKVIGPINIGNNCVIGANAVVIDSVPDNCLVAGVPARIIKEDIKIKNYR
ncbi:serine acetyltransferase [Desulfosarcina ovata subsp. sediminis]|uniref:Serine acetyltransferase n=1 Tax=Desulfosarcina ovata subsp. sediminis TaxID=885957 RepID=A0A5K7ZR49_9BACT|nr:serine acetyltransferase [Desulfosarcina ovata]BBO82760.1 serine acetyltransferase [Desulfosarcina ovata subsp. sediminis]